MDTSTRERAVARAPGPWRRVVAACAIAVLTAIGFAAGSPTIRGSVQDLGARCDELAGRLDLWGVVLVARGDELLVQRAYGTADVATEAPNRVDTRFLVASLTKPVVGFLALRLVDGGTLELDAPVARHVEELRDAPVGRATVHQLLTHTSGLPHYEGWPGFLERVGEEHGEAELLARLAATELVDEPGASHRYSGPGYLLLGLVLERAAGAPLPDLLEQHVLAPLGMDSTLLLPAAGADDVDHARPHARGAGPDDPPRPAARRHPSTLRATGGLVTTAGDLHRFARAVQTGALLSEGAHATLLRPVLGRHACGLIVYRHPWTGSRFARHAGNMDGVAAHLVFGLDDERVCVALANLAPTAVNDLDDALLLATPPEAPGDGAEAR